MKRAVTKIFSVLCVALLVFSTFAPSLASAVGLYSVQITVDAGSNARTIQNVSATAIKENSYTGANIFYYDSTNKQLTLDSVNAIEMGGQYHFRYVITYVENDSSGNPITYNYVGEKVLTGEQLTSLSTLAVPTTENLNVTSFTNDIAERNYSGNIDFTQVNDYSSQQLTYGVKIFNSKLVVDKVDAPQLSYLLSAYDTTAGASNYLLTGTVDFTKTENKTSILDDNVVNIKHDFASPAFVRVSPNSFKHFVNVSADFYVTPGSYLIEYGSDETNYSYWHGTVDLTTAKTLTLSTNPTKVQLDKVQMYAKSETLNFNYNMMISNDAGHTFYSNAPTVTGKVVNTENTIVDATVDATQNYATVTMPKVYSGKYSLQLTVSYGDQTFTVSYPFEYNSPWNELSGTVVTAEGQDGVNLKDATIEVYENEGYYYNRVFTRTDSEGKGELFVPDAYLLKDMPYLLVVKNSAQDVYYVKEIIGQSANTLHFDSDTLKPVTIKADGFTLKKSNYSIKGSKGTILDLNKSSSTSSWSISTDATLILDGNAESTDAKTGYKLYQLPFDATQTLDLSKVVWKTVKASSAYQTGGYTATVGDYTNSDYTELKVPAANAYYDSVILKVTDGTNVYTQTNYMSPITTVDSLELAFSSYVGEAYYDENNGTQNISTYYHDNSNDGWLDNVIGSNVQLTYVITNINGETTTVQTDNLWNIQLPQALAPGEYKIKLVDSTLNKDILSLSFDSTFIVKDATNANSGSQFPTEMGLNLNTAYGTIASYGYGNSLQIYEEDTNSYFRNVIEYYYDSTSGKLKSYYSNPPAIDTTKNYKLIVQSRLQTNDQQSLVEIVDVKGNDLSNYLSTPFTFSSDLLKVTIDNTNAGIENTGLNMYVNVKDIYGLRPINVYSYGVKSDIYLSAGNYSIEGSIDDMNQKTEKLFTVFDGTLTNNQTVTVSDANLAKIVVQKEGKNLPVFATNFGANGYSYSLDLNYTYNNLYVGKKLYNPLYLGVVVGNQYDTPWGYVLSKDNATISSDTTFDVTGDITGNIIDVQAITESYEDSYKGINQYSPSYTNLNVNLALTLGEFNVEQIFRATEDRNAYALGTTNPIREYYGLFTSLNEVPVSYKVLDSTGKVVIEGSNNYYYSSNYQIFTEKVLPDGVYTLQLNVPTAPRQSLSLQKSFVVGTPTSGEYVTINTPSSNSVTNQSSIVVSGVATPNATVTVELKDSTSIVGTPQTVTVTAEGTYKTTVTAPSTKDGVYTVNVKNGQATTSASVTVDRVAPSKVTGVTAKETQQGIQVDWTSVTDANSYVVEYAKGTEAFQSSAVLTSTSFTIPNVASDTTYKVRVKAVDAAGNASTSDEATIKTTAFLGAKVNGSVTNNGTGFADATVRLKNNANLYTVQTDAQGNYAFTGIKAGLYDVTVTVDNRSLVYGTVLVTQDDAFIGVTKTVASIQVITFVTPTLSFTDTVADSVTPEGLSVRITGPNNFVAYGSVVNGKFSSYSGTTLKDLATGDYEVTVYGEGLLQTTTQNISINDSKDYVVTVTQENVKTESITFNISPSDLTKLQTISLYSPSVYQKYGYQYNVGYYYQYSPSLSTGQLVITGVVPAADYSLNISADSYMNYSKTVDLSTATTVGVTLEQGRQVSGTVKDVNGVALGGVYVSAYAGNTYYSATTDATGAYTLKNLSKTVAVELNASISGYVSDQKTITAGTANVTQNITLAKAKSISGKVVDEAGTPLTHAYVSVSGTGGYSWARTATDGTFVANGLKEGSTYDVTISYYGYPTKTLKGVLVGDKGTITLQKNTSGNFKGEGNYFAISKDTVASGESVQFTVAYQNNSIEVENNVPVTITLPSEMTLIEDSVQLNGKDVAVNAGQITIPSVAVGEAGKITYKATVGSNVSNPTLTASAQVGTQGEIQSATTSVVFVTLEAPAQTKTKQVKVYGTAKLGSTVEVYADNVLVGQQKVDSKWWYATIELPVTDLTQKQDFNITAKVTNFDKVSYAQPVKVTYAPNVPVIQDVTVTAGWNGDVKLNPYTGVATFAITEHTWMPTTIEFDPEVDSASLNFLGKSYAMTKNGATFTFDGNFGKWTSYGEQLLEVTYKKGDITVTVPLMNIIVLIDPSGYVFEGTMDNKLEGVQAVVEVKDASGKWVQWDAAKYGQVNPQTTDVDGRYGWDVINGEWRVVFTKEGYKPYISRVMKVPPAETELNVPMVKVTDPIITTKAEEVSTSNLTITFDRYMNVSTNAVKLYKVEGTTQTEVAGKVKTENKDGYNALATVPTDKTNGFVQNDSNAETGFFTVDPTTKVSKTFTFVPSAALTPGATYMLKVDGNITDEDRRTLGVTKEFSFVAKELTWLEKLQLVVTDLFSGSFIRADFAVLAEQAISFKAQVGTIADTVLSQQFEQIQTLYNKMKNLTFTNSDKYQPSQAIPVLEKKQWTVTFSQSVQDSQTNRAKLKVVDMFGEPVDVTIAINNDKVVITPTNPYIADVNYTLVVEAGLVSGDGKQTLAKGTHYTFQFKK